MKMSLKVTSVLMSMSLAMNISAPIFAESYKPDSVNDTLYAKNIEESNIITAKTDSQEFLFGSDDVVYDFDNAVRINTVDENTGKINLSDSQGVDVLVPVKDSQGDFLSYAEFEFDNGEYKFVSANSGEFYTELFNTISSGSFRDSIVSNNNVYLCSDADLDDIGFFIDAEKNLNDSFLDFSETFNKGIDLTKEPITSDLFIRSDVLSTYLAEKSVLDGDRLDADESDFRIQTTANIPEIVDKIDFLDMMNDCSDVALNDGLKEKILTGSASIVHYVTPSITLAPGVSYEFAPDHSLYMNDCVCFDASVSFSGTPGSGEYAAVGLKNLTYNFYNRKQVTSSTPVSFLEFARLDGIHRVSVKNCSSVNATVSISYYVLRFRDSTSNYNMYIPLFGQEQSNWCWAACVQMIASYVGYDGVSQSSIVYAAHNDYNNTEGTAADYQAGMLYATSNTHTAQRLSYTYTINQLKSSITSDIPIMIIFGTYSGNTRVSGHATVLTGVDLTSTYIRVGDPANGGNVKCYEYSSITDSTATKRYDATCVVSSLTI